MLIIQGVRRYGFSCVIIKKNMKKQNALQKLFLPQSIAIVGASDTEGKIGNLLVRNMKTYGYNGDVYYVNNRVATVGGERTYASVEEIGTSIDVTIIAIPAQYVYAVIASAATYCKHFIVISAGFGEAGIDGHNREMQLHALAQEKKLTIMGPNCLGFLMPRLALNLSFAPGMPPVGDTAFVSQSGALAVAIIDRAQALGIGFSYVISIGNKMQVSEVDIITYLRDDQYTKTIILYLESIQDGSAFMQAVSDARRSGKRVIILKAGKTKAAQKAIALHTGSLTSGDVVVQAVFDRLGVVRAETIDDLFVAARVAHTMPIVKKDHLRFAVITNAGGPGVITTDFIAQTRHLTRAKLSARTLAQLKDVLPVAASTHNPIDVLGDALLDRYEQAIDICLKDKNVDAILVLLTPQEQTPCDDIAKMLVRRNQDASKILMASFIGGVSVARAMELLRNGDVLHGETPSALLAMLDDIIEADRCAVPMLRPIKVEAQKTAARILSRYKKQHYHGVYFADATKIMKSYGVRVVKHWDITAGFGTATPVTYPCVAKVDDPHLLHKSDRGGVILPIQSTAQLQRARKKLRKDFPQKTVRIIAQPLLASRMELIIGMKRDASFGPVIIVGLGGIYTEIFHKTDVFVTPFGVRDVKKRLQQGALAFLFDGTRGQTPYDLSAVVNVVMALQQISVACDDVRAIDINPYLLSQKPDKSFAVDIKIIF